MVMERNHNCLRMEVRDTDLMRGDYQYVVFLLPAASGVECPELDLIALLRCLHTPW